MVARALILAACLSACRSGESPALDAAPASPDAGIDAAALDFGRVSGECDVLDSELFSPSPGFFRLAIDFDRLYTEADADLLSPGAREILADGNAGGSSVLSEVFAYEVLERCESALLLKTETEIEYDQPGKLTDFLAELATEKIGVSVTRAMGFPFDAPYTMMQADTLLSDKLADILVSSANVSDADRWRKQILAVLAVSPEHADALNLAYAGLEAGVKADTLVYVIVTNGSDDFIYCDGVCE
jgi:hypothetical protein